MQSDRFRTLLTHPGPFATAYFDDPEKIAEASRGLGEAMVGINVGDLPAPHRLAERGW